MTNNQQSHPLTLPLLPLRDVVVFPHMVMPLFVGRSKSIKALDQAKAENTPIMLVAQKSATQDDPTIKEIHTIGCVANILQLLRLPDGTVKVLVEGVSRANILEIKDAADLYTCSYELMDSEVSESLESEAMRRLIFAEFEQYLKLNKKIPPEILASLQSIESSSRLADTIVAHLTLKLEQKQKALEMFDVVNRMEFLLEVLTAEIDLLQVERRIRGRVKKQMEKSQRDYYLNEQVRAIQKELGEGEDGADIEEIEKKIEKSGMSKEARKKADAELKKLRLMSPMSAEATVVRNYLDAVIGLPWKKKSRVNLSLDHAETVLEADHHGLEKVKERILEYLAVQQRVTTMKSPILCLVGPPGVGKTSLGQSIAKATNRKFLRMALGGVRDESEIRGHRRTYIGSMPGKVLQNLTKVGVKNPLFLLDEIDKLGTDFRGDPASALLEVLDPEQNSTFQDHYVDVEFDLSQVMFIATSNTLNIPPALLDRMEVIRLSGYTEDEKINIAAQHLIPKQIEQNGLKDTEIAIDKSAIVDIVRYYTREAGVRNLEREINKICRKVVRAQLAAKRAKKITVQSKNLQDYLGVRKFDFGLAEKENRVGQVSGLAWTEVGGDLLSIEVVSVPGKGNITRTGSLGEVMKESVEAARTVVRSRAERLGIATEAFEKADLHAHFPEGATPKDGPSAGIAITTAIVSALTNIPIRSDIAMTGEITIHGEVLPIGGLKEKLLAAARGGIRTVLIPENNVKDLHEIPDNIKGSLEIIPVKWIDRVLELALERYPEPLKRTTVAEADEPSMKAALNPLSEVVKH